MLIITSYHVEAAKALSSYRVSLSRGVHTFRGGGPDSRRPNSCTGNFGQDRHDATRVVRSCKSLQKSADSPDLPKRNKTVNTAFLLLLLLAAYCHNQCTRCLVVYAVNFSLENVNKGKEYLNVALNIDPAQYALMASYGFTLLYAICSFFAGLVADRTDRVKTLCIAVLGWSLALAAQGTICTNFAAIFGCRVIQGIAMAFTGPQCLSLITDYFLPTSRATALAIYTSGVYLGGALGSLSIMSNLRLGWRFTFVAWAAVGIVIAGIVYANLEDPKVKVSVPADVPKNTVVDSVLLNSAGSPAPGFPHAILKGFVDAANLIREICDSVTRVAGPRSVKLILLATGFRFCAGYSIGCWSSPYFRARFPEQQAVFSLINAAIIAGCGSLSAFAGGLVCDAFTRARKRPCSDVKMLVSMMGCLLAIPAWILSIRAPGFWPAMLFLAVETLVAECWMGPTLAVLAEEAPPEVRVLPSRAPHSRFRPSRAAHSRLRQLLPPSLTLLR
jgi:MFS family permease